MVEVLDLKAEQWEEEVLNSERPVVVDFWHQMCGWCLKLNPIYEELPRLIDDVKFVKMNILQSTANRKIAMDLGVLGTPTMKILCKGRVIGEIIGFRSLDSLAKEITEIISKKDDCLEKSTPLSE